MIFASARSSRDSQTRQSTWTAEPLYNTSHFRLLACYSSSVSPEQWEQVETQPAESTQTVVPASSSGNIRVAPRALRLLGTSSRDGSSVAASVTSCRCFLHRRFSSDLFRPINVLPQGTMQKPCKKSSSADISLGDRVGDAW